MSIAKTGVFWAEMAVFGSTLPVSEDIPEVLGMKKSRPIGWKRGWRHFWSGTAPFRFDPRLRAVCRDFLWRWRGGNGSILGSVDWIFVVRKSAFEPTKQVVCCTFGVLRFSVEFLDRFTSHCENTEQNTSILG